MADKIIVDTSVLIDYYCKTDKDNSAWVQLLREGHSFAISVVTKYEIYTGATESQLHFWSDVLKQLEVIPLDEACVDVAVSLNAALKQKRKQLDIADLFIAATAILHGLSMATLNKKHFERVDDLQIVE